MSVFPSAKTTTKLLTVPVAVWQVVSPRHTPEEIYYMPRPARADRPESYLSLKVKTERYARWAAAASLEDRSFSSWVRDRLDRAATAALTEREKSTAIVP